MKIGPRFLLSALGVLALTGCGGGGGSDSPARGGEEMAAPSESSGEAAAQLGSGESADIELFFRDKEGTVIGSKSEPGGFETEPAADS
jgi:hypothetical protein